ncbi:polysaccharide biosynthesis C-terminal domain-containing protein [Fluviicola sp.]|uniref:lipopolysaccharide biosynthesis protein n=1 Tax=Fluviicola sp. TaxID=1917219 RepID=UPI002623AE44|nr:polysaccharide biosynthesis C-terminal domain-containing protein [Fluviicola sp.]
MNKLLSDSLVYGISNIAGKLINIFMLPIYASSFSVEDYGTLSIVVVFTAIISQLTILQLDSASFRFVSAESPLLEKQKTYSTWFFTEAGISLVFLLIFSLFSSGLSSILLGSSQFSNLLLIGLLIIPINTVEYVALTEMRLRNWKWFITGLNLSSATLQIILTYILITHFNQGIIAILYANLIISVMKSLICYFPIIHFIRIKSFSLIHLKELLLYCLPFVPAGLSLWVVSFIDRFMIEKISNSYNVGIYQMGNTIASIVLLPISGFLFAWPPYVFSLLNNPKHKRIISTIVELFTLNAAVICLIFSAFASEALSLFANEKYFAAIQVIPFLLFSNLSMGLYQLSGIGSAIAKKTKPVMWATLFGALLNIVLNFILIPMWGGVYGASFATLISYSAIPLVLFRISQKNYPIPFNFIKIILYYLFPFTLSLLCNVYFENFGLSVSFFVIKLIGSFLVLGALIFLNIRIYKKNINKEEA